MVMGRRLWQLAEERSGDGGRSEQPGHLQHRHGCHVLQTGRAHQDSGAPSGVPLCHHSQAAHFRGIFQGQDQGVQSINYKQQII